MLSSVWSFIRVTAAPALLVFAAVVVTFGQDNAFETTSGENLKLSSLKGKVVVLVFSSTQDPQCRDEFKSLAVLGARYADKNVAIYWVSTDPAAKHSDRQFVDTCGPADGIVILHDRDRAAYKRYSGKDPRIPIIVVIDKNGELGRRPLEGFNPEPEFVDTLGSLIDGLLAAK
jgi:peroxiredoxin